MKKRIVIAIAKDFSDVPGGRYKKDGKWSGEEFRQQFLEPAIQDEEVEKVVVDLDGTFGYSVSFLEEAFGGLALIYGEKKVLDRVELISTEQPSLIERIKELYQRKNERQRYTEMFFDYFFNRLCK